MSVQICKARVEDAQAITTLLTEIGWWPYMSFENSEATLERITHHLDLCTSDNSHSIYLAKEENGEVIGYTSVHWLPYLFLPGPEGYVSELFVAESSRGSGVGKQLFEVVKNEAEERGCYRLMLLNGRQRESYRREFYKKLGWEERQYMANLIYPLKA